MVYTVYMTLNKTADKIARAARMLLDAEGADAVTMRRVAKAVGITPMAVYRHYADREGLLNALADEGFEELAARLKGTVLSGDMGERLSMLADVYLEHALENPRLFELMFLKPRAGARRYPEDFRTGLSPTANPVAELIREGIESGYLRAEDVWSVTFEVGALSHGLIMLYLGGRTSMLPEDFRSFYQRSLRRYIDGIRN